MKALILAAGYGVRLYPLTKKWPKPLLKIGNQPVIEYIIETIERNKEIDKIYVVTNNKFYSKFALWSKAFKSKLPVEIINDGTTKNENRLGAIGDIKFSIDKKKIYDDILIIGGDNLFKFNLGPFIELGRKTGSFILGVYDIRKKSSATRFGVVTIDKRTFKVKSFEEKPAKPKSSYIATCAYLFPKDRLNMIDKYIGQKNNLDAPGHYISWLVKRRYNMYACLFKGKWFDIGQKETFRAARRGFK